MHGSDTPARRPVATAEVLSVEGPERRRRPDRVVTEEPLEIRLHGPGEEPAPLAVTMRTPGHDFDLAAGLCFTEGIVRPGEIERISYCLAGDGRQRYNVVSVGCRRRLARAWSARRFPAASGCGICGKATLDDIEVRCEPVEAGPVVAASTLTSLPARLGAAQSVFDQTGGLHAAAAFDARGALVSTREDVGRHNALDKLIGEAVLAQGVPLADRVLLVSGRLGFELVQKALVAGFPLVCAVSAPSSLAIAAARRFGQTLVGFLRDGRFNVYTHPERIDVAA